MNLNSSSYFAAMVATAAFSGIGHAAFPTLKLQPLVLQQIHSPTAMVAPPGDGTRVFICDQPGKIFIFRNGMLRPTPFLDIGPRMIALGTSGSELGLLGLAFHPGYSDATSLGHRKFYLAYTASPSTATLNPSSPMSSVCVIAEYQTSLTQPDLADPLSHRVVFTTGRPQSNHNGGQLDFGPDGYLYISSGDGGGGGDNGAGHTAGNTTGSSGVLGNGQDRRNLLGKILRIDPLDPDAAGPLTYSIPTSNPFIGQSQDFTDNALDGPLRGEIYAYGLRNPWRFSFDKRPGGTGRLFCGDVGQGKVEEVNIITRGGNYGWRFREGNFDFDAQMITNGVAPSSHLAPIAQYAHPGVSIGTPALPQLGVSITGGYVYRGAAIPQLQGKYLFADYSTSGSNKTGRVMGLEETAADSGVFALASAISLTGGNPLSTSVQTFGETGSGEILVGTKSNSGVLQLAAGYPAGGIYQVVSADYQPAAYQTWLTTHFPTLLTGQFLDPQADPDGDGVVNEIEYAYDTNPLLADTAAQTRFTAVATPATAGSIDFTVTFRRSPRATDLTYQLEVSSDLSVWTTIATSTGGATTLAVNGGEIISDAEIVGQAGTQLVTAKINLAATLNTRHFVRLHTTRSL